MFPGPSTRRPRRRSRRAGQKARLYLSSCFFRSLMRRRTDASRASIFCFASCSVSGRQREGRRRRGTGHPEGRWRRGTGHRVAPHRAQPARRAVHHYTHLCGRCILLGYVSRRPGAEQGIRARGIQLKADNPEEHQQRSASDDKACSPHLLQHRRQFPCEATRRARTHGFVHQTELEAQDCVAMVKLHPVQLADDFKTDSVPHGLSSHAAEDQPESRTSLRPNAFLSEKSFKKR